MRRIAAVRVVPLTVPFDTPVRTATTVWRVRELALVRLIEEGGLEGLGEVVETGSAGPTTTEAEVLALTMVGVDVSDRDQVRDAVIRIAGNAPALAAAIASATWDLRARLAGRRLADELGTRRTDSVAVNGLVGATTPAAAAASARSLADAGLMCIKVKAGAESPAATLERVAAIRAAVGGGIDIRLDHNGARDQASAPRLLRDLVPHRVDYVEDPLPARAETSAVAALRTESPIPIAIDDGVVDLAAAERLLQAEAVDVLVIKPSRVGGLGAAAAIVATAAEAGVTVVLSTMFETGIGLAGAAHLAATVPGNEVAHGLATADLLASDLLLRPLSIEDGRMALPEGPGLGVELDEAALARFEAA